MFRLTQHGIHLTFPNNWSLSVQWGPSNYCTNRSWDFNWGNADVTKWTIEHPSAEVEIAIFYEDYELLDPLTAKEHFSNETLNAFGNDTVAGWQKITDVLRVMNEVADLPDEPLGTNPR